MNNKILLMVFGTGLGLALALPAAAEKGQGPCAEDAAKFCKDVKPGEGRVLACLKEHEKELSQACRDRKSAAAARRGAGQARNKGSRGGVCMREYGQGFASGFKRGFKMRAGLGRGEGRGGKKGVAAGVCTADARKLCGEVKPGEGRVRDCLIKNAGKLSDDCKTRVEKAKERQEEKGKKV